MKPISHWVEILDAGISRVTVLQLIKKDVLEEAERIARRDEHTETADKIAALKNVP